WLEQLVAYHKELQESLREHETKFDNAVLLVAGGALTVSAAFLPGSPTPFHAKTALVLAWGAWTACLATGIGGHLVGARATKRVLGLLEKREYDPGVLAAGWAARFVEPLNYATYALLVAGFVAFGVFTFANVDFGGQRGQEAKSQQSPK